MDEELELDLDLAVFSFKERNNMLSIHTVQLSSEIII